MPPTVVTSLTVVVGASGGGVAHAANNRLRSKGSIFVFMVGITLAFIRQLNAKMGATLVRHQLHHAVMRQYILAHDRQTDAVAVSRALRLVQALIERIENPIGVG